MIPLLSELVLMAISEAVCFSTRLISTEASTQLSSLDEILLSSDKTIAIIDGSGVAHDPSGLDRTELKRLARARKTIAHFDQSKLSSQGYVILIEERDQVLPSTSHLLP
jgi:hypothetical protein